MGLPDLIFLSGESIDQRSLVGYSALICQRSDSTEVTISSAMVSFYTIHTVCKASCFWMMNMNQSILWYSLVLSCNMISFFLNLFII